MDAAIQVTGLWLFPTEYANAMTERLPVTEMAT
jgi:hypothetical protein